MTHDIETLSKASRKEKDAQVMRRMGAVLTVLGTGTSAEQVAELLEVDPTSVRRWVRNFEEGGPEALRDLPRTGRPPGISAGQLDRCMQWAFEQEGVTPSQLQQHIAEETGRTFHITYIRKLMHEYGLSQMAATRVHVNAAGSSTVRGWSYRARQDVLRLKKEGYAIVTEDEAFFVHETATGRKYWGPTGERIYRRYTGSHKRIAVFGAVSDDGRLAVPVA